MLLVSEVVFPISLKKSFYYLPPENIDHKNIVGKRVKVQFGRKILNAYVISYQSLKNDYSLKLKRIIEIIDNKSLINEETMKLANYISKNYLCSLGQALASIIPMSMTPQKRPKKNKDIIDKNVVTCESQILNMQQLIAINLINKNLENNTYNSFLLHGVNASGKTEVYVRTIKYALKQNKSAIVLVPEIFLIVQFIDVMTKIFGSKVNVWHSGVSNAKKYNLFLKAKNGDIEIIIGTRSAIFTPLKNLGIIVVDEEHERAYKQERRPFYDAREIAKWRGKYHNAVVILGSATPSLESYKDALENKVKLVELKERVDKKELPEIKILTLKNKIFKTSSLLSETIESISKVLAKKEQVIVFLNRRGYFSVIICKKCGCVYQCPKCSISMIFYRNPDLLKCHYCSYTKTLPIACKVCESKDIRVFGTGTQKVEFELKTLFSDARIFRLDGDTAHSNKSYKKVYYGMKNEKYDILIGTQMITKGFDFPKVSLVCIVDADMFLYIPSFKSVEKTFQLITQIAGRCGRGDMRGSVIVQTSHPKHYAIEYAKSYNYISFYKTEIELRKKLFYPPYCFIAKILIKNKKEKTADDDSEKILFFLEKVIKNYDLKLKLMGPVCEYISKLNNVYRKQIIIKGDKEDILKLAEQFEKFRQSHKIFIAIEIMPSDLM
jgi:primosomal protein N' (replication factor Y)